MIDPVTIAIEYLDAELELGGTYRYWDDATGSWWRVRRQGLAALGERLASCRLERDRADELANWSGDPTVWAEEVIE